MLVVAVIEAGAVSLHWMAQGGASGVKKTARIGRDQMAGPLRKVARAGPRDPTRLPETPQIRCRPNDSEVLQ